MFLSCIQSTLMGKTTKAWCQSQLTPEPCRTKSEPRAREKQDAEERKASRSMRVWGTDKRRIST